METEKKNRKCVVKCNGYEAYHYGGGRYGSDFSKVNISYYGKLPKYIKNNPLNVIIPLDTAEGLELLVGEIENIKQKIKQEKDENEVKRMKAGLKRLRNSNPEMIDEYNCKRAKYLSISCFSPERKRLIIKEIVRRERIILE
ncbi:MAG: hypothetical protein NTZ83_01210 [Candidatus Pacearchaeota archaeon]|nr:hypothetical protein [Candidatus Pacearchaeota archaeon]